MSQGNPGESWSSAICCCPWLTLAVEGRSLLLEIPCPLVTGLEELELDQNPPP